MSITELGRSVALRSAQLTRSDAILDAPPDFIETLPAAFYACDAQGRILWFNARAVEWWGAAPQAGFDTEQGCGSYRIYVDGCEIKRARTPMAWLRRAHAIPAEVELLLERPDGSRRWAALNSQPVHDADGALAGAVHCLNDTTRFHGLNRALRTTDEIADRRRARELERRLSLIVESSDDAIISKDTRGIIATWNAGAERIFGYTADEAIGRSITMLIPSDRHDEEPHILSRILRGERIDHYETVRRRKDGRLIDISLTVSPMKDDDGNIIGAAKIARDITGQKQAQARIKESEQRLQDLLAALPGAIYTTDAAGRITYYNQAAVEFAGREPVIGSDEWCVTWKLYWPDGRPLPHDQCPMAVALREGRAIRNVEAVAERPDGTRVPFIPYPTPLRDFAGNVIGAVNLLVDISERKQAETQQRLLLRELNHRVKNNMQMLHVLLNSALRDTQSAEARLVLEDAGRRIAAMAAVQHVLYATTDAARFNASDFMRTLCNTAEQAFGPNVEVSIEQASGQLSNDAAVPLALILNELMTNAVKHGLKGRLEGAIKVGLVQDAGTFELYVEDDGPGFELQQTRRYSSGLGLVQALAQQLKGEFRVMRGDGVTRCSLRFKDVLADTE